MPNILTGLNSKQKEAVLCTEGPLLIMAGAGSGKTRVLTHRIAYLIKEKNVMPWHVLAITFTNKAANEMRSRINQLLGSSGDDAWVSTFHALGARILRRYIDKLGYSRSFTISGVSEQRTLVKHIMSELNLDPKQNNPKSILAEISNAKNNLDDAEHYNNKFGDSNNPNKKVTAQVYLKYQKELKQNQSIDFDDLIMLPIKILKQFPDILSYYQDKFRYINVDEYQDTNEAQYRLVNLLAKKYQNICVVGDADQSIYGWRGANMNNILDFQDDYPKAHVTLMEQNYRSTKTILDAANSVIKNNEGRKPKKLWTENDSGKKISYYRGQNEHDESYYVVSQIKNLKNKQHLSYNDFAVLYRTNAQSRVIEETLLKSNIPYNIVGGNRFYDRKEIQDILAYLTVLSNPDDSMSLTRIINVPKRKIGPSSVEKLRIFAEDNHWNMLKAAQNMDINNDVSNRIKNSIGSFGAIISKLQSEVDNLSVTDLTRKVLKQTGYLDSLKLSKSLESKARIENIEEFLSVTQQYDTKHQDDDLSGRLSDFLSDLSLVSAQDDVDEKSPQVTLMTLHAAKGLEFPVVFMIGMEEGIFPLASANDDPSELEEERRLAYVGITRAQRKLYLTNSYSRMLYGRMQTNPESRFIKEIDPSLIHSDNKQSELNHKIPFANSIQRNRYQRANQSIYHRPDQVVEKPKETGANHKDWQIGTKVRHKAWGVGTVVKIEGTGDDMELDIAFPSKGIKRLLAAFAPINKIK
ncbi:DNA helicase [Philodulcilactobacillus myokoensis]|uniref:ATP-dependent DNA helicase n=2 Tax=Philodulcilactobacillus myokoensis TaxID=2929573 RepID=A0A9W6ES03_9LACO|nr:DNA helicase [Philodulcilactobacillus myokoensis]